MPESIALTLYKALILPPFDYGDTIYCHTSQGNLGKSQIMQNNACRMILRAGNYDSTLEMHNKLDLDFLAERRSFPISGYMFKSLNNLVKSPDIISLFEPLNCVHGANTRAAGRNDLIVPVTLTRFGAKSLAVFW